MENMTKDKVKEYIEMLAEFHFEDRCTVDELPSAQAELKVILDWIEAHCQDSINA